MNSEPEGSLGLWAVPRMVVATQFLAGAIFFVMALVNLAGDEPSGWQRLLGVAAALVAGLAFGVAGSLRASSRMVRRHMETWHPDVPVADNGSTRVTPVDR